MGYRPNARQIILSLNPQKTQIEAIPHFLALFALERGASSFQAMELLDIALTVRAKLLLLLEQRRLQILLVCRMPVWLRAMEFLDIAIKVPAKLLLLSGQRRLRSSFVPPMGVWLQVVELPDIAVKVPAKLLPLSGQHRLQ
jgi:hypothetical protein